MGDRVRGFRGPLHETGGARFADYEVIKCDVPGLFDGAYVTRRYRYSGRSYLARTDDIARRRSVDDAEQALRNCGIFLQGVRVLTGSPGFGSEGPIAVINGIGMKVPRTNVARSGIEQGENYKSFLKEIYGIYLTQGRGEVDRWSAAAKNQSLTTRGRRISSLFSILSLNASPIDRKLFQQQLDDEKRLIVEIRGERKLVSRTDLLSMPEFDTVDSKFVQTAEELIENLSATRSLNDIIASLDLPPINAKSEVILTGPAEHLDNRTLDKLAINNINFDETSLQLSINWKCVDEESQSLRRLRPNHKRLAEGSYTPVILVPEDAVGRDCRWAEDSILVCLYGSFIHPRNPQAAYFQYLAAEETREDDPPELRAAMIDVISQLWHHKQYDRARPLEEVAASYGRGDAEQMLATLKDRVNAFRDMRVIRIGEDDLLW